MALVDILNPRCVCMKDEKCSKHYPKGFDSSTMINTYGYPTYKDETMEERLKLGEHLLIIAG